MATNYHVDPTVNQALIKLNDALCTFERSVGRECTLILVPHSDDEVIHVSQSGKPINLDCGLTPERILQLAMESRNQKD